VQGILVDQWDGTTDLTPFIASASMLIDQVAQMALQMSFPISYTVGQLELIERWLSAHLYKQMDMMLQQKATGGASGVYQGKTGMSLDSTRYGQTAMTLDYSGALSAISKRATAGGFLAHHVWADYGYGSLGYQP
jgi:hypothetical protein